MKKEKGSIIIYSTMLMAVILGISLTLVGMFLPKLRSVSQATNSAISLYAADSASELCLYQARKMSPDMGQLSASMLGNGARFTVNRTSDGTAVNFGAGQNCSDIMGSQSFGFRAAGMYQGVTRTLEVTQ